MHDTCLCVEHVAVICSSMQATLVHGLLMPRPVCRPAHVHTHPASAPALAGLQPQCVLTCCRHGHAWGCWRKCYHCCCSLGRRSGLELQPAFDRQLGHKLQPLGSSNCLYLLQVAAADGSRVWVTPGWCHLGNDLVTDVHLTCTASRKQVVMYQAGHLLS
jgi:hypothetical protein